MLALVVALAAVAPFPEDAPASDHVDRPGFALGAGVGASTALLRPMTALSLDVGYVFANSYGVDVFTDLGNFATRPDVWWAGGALSAIASTRVVRDLAWSPIIGVGPTVGAAYVHDSDVLYGGPYAGAGLMLAMRVPATDWLRVDVTARANLAFPALATGALTVGASWLP